MFDTLMWLVLAIVFIALPISIVLLIVRAIKKKPVKKILKSIGVLFLAALVLFIAAMFAPDDTPTEESQSTETVETTTVETTETETATELVKQEETTVQYSSVMIEQFKSLGFTYTEAKKVESIFKTVGITEISNIQAVGSNGIDNLQAFRCDIFDSKKDKGGPSLLFTVEKRQLCHISLNGFMNSNSLQYDSVVLYDIWNEDGTINNDTIGYKYVVDYENGKITKYEP